MINVLMATVQYIEQHLKEPRLAVVSNECNLDVGGAVLTGYRHAIAEDATVMVTIDRDGQMNRVVFCRNLLP